MRRTSPSAANSWAATPKPAASTPARCVQLVTGSTGLDSHEWGVTLFAHDVFQIKSIVYEMRWDEVTTQFGEFGDFFIGIQLPVPALLERVLGA